MRADFIIQNNNSTSHMSSRYNRFSSDFAATCLHTEIAQLAVR